MIQHLSQIDEALILTYPGITIGHLTCLIRTNTIPELWRAKAVILVVGTNNIANGSSEQDIMGDYMRLIQNLKHYNRYMHIFLCTVLP